MLGWIHVFVTIDILGMKAGFYKPVRFIVVRVNGYVIFSILKMVNMNLDRLVYTASERI